jgi:hypothetical protein
VGNAISVKDISRRMSGDWNRRARSDPRYYVALGRADQSWQAFVSDAEDLVRSFEPLPKAGAL